MKQQLTIKLGLRDKHAAELNRQARAVSYVWNYLNAVQKHFATWDSKIARREHLRLSAYDLIRLTVGAGKELECATVHDRDVNAARNILRLGLETLVEGALRC